MTKGEATRQFIIEKAAPVFNMKGIAATAMSDIMEVTGLSKGSLYVHFENKDVLAASVVDYNMDMLFRKLFLAIDRHNDPKDKLFAYLDVYMDPSNPPILGGCPLMNFGMEADDTNEPIRQRVAKMVQKNQDILADILQQGIKKEVFNPEWNHKEFATLMFAMIEGGLMISRISGDHRKMRMIIRNIRRMIDEQTIG